MSAPHSACFEGALRGISTTSTGWSRDRAGYDERPADGQRLAGRTAGQRRRPPRHLHRCACQFGARVPTLALAVIAVVAFDQFGGAVANATAAAKRRFQGPRAAGGTSWYSSRIHIQPFVLALVVPGLGWAATAVIYGPVLAGPSGCWPPRVGAASQSPRATVHDPSGAATSSTIRGCASRWAGAPRGLTCPLPAAESGRWLAEYARHHPARPRRCCGRSARTPTGRLRPTNGWIGPRARRPDRRDDARATSRGAGLGSLTGRRRRWRRPRRRG
jgi:hypothetical protein